MRIGHVAILCCLHFLLLTSASVAAEMSVKQTGELKDAIAVSSDFSIYAERIKTGKRIFDYVLMIKEVSSGKELKPLDWEKDWGDPKDAFFSPDGKKLAILWGEVGKLKTARVFDVGSGEMKLNVRHEMLKFVAFTPDSKRLVSVGGPGASNPKETLWIWDVETRQKIIIESPSTPTCLAFSLDQKLVVTAHEQYAFDQPLLTACEVATGKRVATINREGKENAVAVAFSPDSKLLAAGTRDGVIKLFEVTKGKNVTGKGIGKDGKKFDVGVLKKVGSFDDIQDEILGVAFHPTENLIAATGKDKTIRFWDLKSKKLVSTTKLPTRYFKLHLQFSIDGAQLATIAGNGITLWTVEVRKQ